MEALYSISARGHYDDYFDYDGLYANAAANNEYDLSSSRFLISIIITIITIKLPRKIDIKWNREEDIMKLYMWEVKDTAINNKNITI